MDCFMRNIPYAVDEVQLNRQLRPTLHGPVFEPVFQGGAPFDYRIQLFKGKRRGQSHSGCGTITVPTEAIGQRLVDLGSISVHGRVVCFTRSDRPARPEHIAMIQRPYQDPVAREQEVQRRAELATQIDVSWVKLCWAGFEEVSIEWENHGNWSVSFDGNSRAIVLQRGSWRIIMRNATVDSIEEDGDSCHLSLDVPPTLETEPQTEDDDPFDFSSLLESLGFQPPPLLRDRQSVLEEAQEAIIPFANVLRFRFVNPYSGMERFRSNVQLIDRRVHAYHGPRPTSRGLFTSHSLNQLQEWCQRQEYEIAFQVHKILCKRLVAPAMLLALIPTLDQIIRDLESIEVVDILKRFGMLVEEPEESMEGWNPTQFLASCFESRATHSHRREIPQEEASRLFECYHVTITPTSQLLSGPLPETTNRVLRWYPDHQHQFLRVDFAEEDGNNLRLDRDVDGPKFVQKRFGDVLKRGIMVAGRRFEFLAYSQSALREHTVWFVSPFRTREHERVTGASIRTRLGDFTRVARCPARYGARLSQAFSSTEPSVTIRADDVQHIPEKRALDNSLFTDGVGTITPDTAERIWEAYTLSRSRRSHRAHQAPSAFQIRFGGCKGMFSVDYTRSGDQVCIRDSMEKFDAPDSLDIEIAKVFDRPTPGFLNRPLIMLLETLGLEKDIFLELQRAAVRATEDAIESLATASLLLNAHGLGTAFSLTSVFSNMARMGADLGTQDDMWPFLEHVLSFCANHILRDLKYRARIQIPGSWMLVGVADEYDLLQEGQIYACTQERGGRREYIRGPVLISRSPTVAPGDARMVMAIGEPADGTPGAIYKRHTNCVIFACSGRRSLPSMLAGGDLDGDEYLLIVEDRLHPPRQAGPLAYGAPQLVTLDRDATIVDVADFVINYINNDILGLIATQQLIMADKSELLLADPDCITLAELHSIAVDFPKTGRHVKYLDLPRDPSREKPDWSASETSDGKAVFYPSRRILGHLYRDITLPAVQEANRERGQQHRRRRHEQQDLEDILASMYYTRREESQITNCLRRRMLDYVDVDDFDHEEVARHLYTLFTTYNQELSSISQTYSLSPRMGLTEEEIVGGTIVQKASQPRRRKDLMAKMRSHSSEVVIQLRADIEGEEETGHEESLLRAWTGWRLSQALGDIYGARSFGLIALAVGFEQMRAIDVEERTADYRSRR